MTAWQSKLFCVGAGTSPLICIYGLYNGLVGWMELSHHSQRDFSLSHLGAVLAITVLFNYSKNF
jgi:hypothetical protein